MATTTIAPAGGSLTLTGSTPPLVSTSPGAAAITLTAGISSVRVSERFIGTNHDDFAAWARELRSYRIERAYDRPHIRLYDGDWNYRGTVYGELSGHVNPIVNKTGTIQLRLPIDLDDPRRTWAAFWAGLDEESRGTRNIHIIVETMGARIGGRMKPKNGVTISRGEKGDEVIIEFFDDIEELKHVHTAGNPFLPLALIQQPKAWMLFAQADHGLLITLAANLLRLQLTNIELPDDLLDPDTWPSNPLDLWAQSQIVVMPRKIGDSVAPLTLIVGSIRTSWFDVAAPILEDAELQLWTRRWLTGDPEPYPGGGTGWRNGTLFVDIVDKSGFRAGTSIGGNLLTGLTRSIASVLTNNVEDSYDLITGETIDETGYRLPGILGTRAPHPYVVYRDGDITGIQTSEFSRSPGGPGRITVGGQSMPGVAVPHRETGGAQAISLSQRIILSSHQLRRRRPRGRADIRHCRPRRGRQYLGRFPGWGFGLIPEPDLPRFHPGPHERPTAGARGRPGLGTLLGDHLHQRHTSLHRIERDGSAGTPPRDRPRHRVRAGGVELLAVGHRR